MFAQMTAYCVRHLTDAANHGAWADELQRLTDVFNLDRKEVDQLLDAYDLSIADYRWHELSDEEASDILCEADQAANSAAITGAVRDARHNRALREIDAAVSVEELVAAVSRV